MGRKAADPGSPAPLRHRGQAPPRGPPLSPGPTPPGLSFPVCASSPQAEGEGPTDRRPDAGLTGRRGTISTEQQWQKYRPGCGDASAMATATSSAPPAPRAAPAAGSLLLPRRPSRPRTLTHGTHGTHGVGRSGARGSRTSSAHSQQWADDGGRRGPN